MSNIATFIAAKQGGKLLIHEGYQYRKNGGSGNGRRIYFKCREGCPASVIVLNGRIVKTSGSHRADHKPNATAEKGDNSAKNSSNFVNWPRRFVHQIKNVPKIKNVKSLTRKNLKNPNVT